MSNNIFEKRTNYRPKVKRNTFDLSFNNNLSMRFGRLTPILCKEVIPGDTFKIDAQAMLYSMPTKFPLQTPCRMHVHFFYCRNRNAVKGWEGFIKGTTPSNEFDMPWLKMTEESARTMISTGSLGDYLGVPSTLIGQRVPTSVINFPTHRIGYRDYDTMPLVMAAGSTEMPSDLNFLKGSSFLPSFVGQPFIRKCLSDNYAIGTTYNDAIIGKYSVKTNKSHPHLWCKVSGNLNSHITSTLHFDGTVLPVGTLPKAQYVNVGLIEDGVFTRYDNQNQAETSLDQPFEFYCSSAFVNAVNAAIDLGKQCQLVVMTCLADSFTSVTAANFAILHNNLMTRPVNNMPLQQWVLQPNIRSFRSCYTQTGSTDSVSDATDPLLVSSNPFIGPNPKIRLNALPFRHYEMIYNSFYREQNQPYVLNDKIEYDEFCPTKEQGADTHVYDFYNRNYERDYFTSCVSSPQFGVAPLVGATVNPNGTASLMFQQTDDSLGNISVDGGENMSVKNFLVEAKLASDGHTLVGINSYDHDLPSGNLHMLMDAITYGISINDFRNVNAFQRFKETMMRAKSFRYKDQMAAQYGVHVDGIAIDTPTFEGGFSFNLGMDTVINQTESSDASLGDIGGRPFISGRNKHSINIYCPEHGYIMAIASICPVPVYPQILPKHFAKKDMLDYGGKDEFKGIGYVPVSVKELTPIQASYEGENLNRTFGYQQAWSEYVSSQDEVHGEMRTTMRDFMLNRVFANTPSLNDDFLTIKNEDLNAPFSYQGNDDKFEGSIYFRIVAHRQVPKFAIPCIE